MRLNSYTLTSLRYPRSGSRATYRPQVVVLLALAAAALSLAMPGRAEAAGMPKVVTGEAAGVTLVDATLNATVDPEGEEVTECKFEYGTTASYGSSAPCTPSPGSGSSPVSVSASVTGLTANTTYHFRISATNAGGTGKGADQTFKTLPNPPTVITGAALSATHSAIFNATVNPNGAVVSDCHFDYGPTLSYGSSAPCTSPPGSGTSAVAVVAFIAGLSENIIYHFRVSATNPGGTGKGSDQTFTTAPTLIIPALGGGTSGEGASPGEGSSGGSSGVKSARIAALLAGQLTPSGKTAKIAALLKSGAFTVAFKALEAGTVVIDWYQIPPGARLAKKARPKPVLVASGEMTFSAARTATVKIRLTAKGKQLLKHAKHIKLTAKGTFTPTGKAPVTALRTFVLKR
jgi:hypothetical protein